MREILKDVSLLNHPEPLEIITNELKNLCDDEYIKMIHRKEPLKLYEILDANNFFYYTMKEGFLFFIFITKQNNKTDLLNFIGKHEEE